MVSPVHVGRALESLRNSDFNTVSAMGEVIDNAIEANAKNIRIEIKKQEIRKNLDDLTEVAFIDDGDGMSTEILHQCLQLGYSERYNNRKGIGRFGVGMTLGAITQCTRIEVYSKPKGGEWNFTYLDLEETKDQIDPIISEPTPSPIPKEYSENIPNNGTIIIWKNWDREDANIKEMIEWIGRTYRKFIGKEIIEGENAIDNKNRVQIFLDGNEISSLDPLYATVTDYNSERAQIVTTVPVEEEIHGFDPPPNKHGASEITIRVSLLPETWRYKPKIGANDENKKRRVTENEGISILRNGREVFYGHIPYFDLQDKKSGRGFIVIDRYWGCEISFNAELDHWFSVKNIKVGARPIPELRKKIEEAIKSTIYECRTEIREVWKKREAELNSKTEISNPNIVKVAVKEKLLDNEFLNAFDFFRAGTVSNYNLYHHIGIYAFTNKALIRYVSLKRSKLELERKLEQLRALDNKMSIHVGYVKSSPLSVDTEEDLIKVKNLMEKK